MKRLLAVLALGSATLLVGACASQGPSYGGGGGGGYGFGYYVEDRYYDCYDSYTRYDCGYPNYYDRNPVGAPQRQTVITGPVHRPIPRVIERPVEGGAPTHSASRSFSRPHADVDSSGSSGGSSGGMSGGAPSSPPPSAPAPAFSAPAPSRGPEPVTVQRSPQ
jgi:hypothetical protein